MSDAPAATEPDPVLVEAAAAVALGHAGDRAGARARLLALWDATEDPLHRVAIAHALADVQDDFGDELRWDRAALAAIDGLTDERVAAAGVAGPMRSLLPSLHLNLADVLRRLGRPDDAAVHVAEARACLDALPADGYRTMIADALDRVAGSLDQPFP